ncbi:MAG: hypothetical protein JNK17_02180 [Hydrogenophaga sp.]|nr:hypothetical protein [Hydrogenophaga sp.]
MRFRYVYMVGGSLAVLAALYFTDPDKGVMTGMAALALVANVLAVAAAHFSRKGMFDYLDLEAVMREAMKSPSGAGRVFQGVCLVIAALLLLFGMSMARAAVPAQAVPYLPVLSAELAKTWPGAPVPGEYFGALVHHESACAVSPRKCWNPAVRLKTPREEGAGLGQLTRAWSKTGALRFDKLAEMRQAHPALRELRWESVYQRADLQLRTMVLMVKADYPRFAGTAEPLAFTDAAYNGGWGGVQKERRACGMTSGCNPQRWFGHVERVCLKSTAALYGQRSACDINRHHVRDVLLVQMPRYRGFV